MSLPDPPHSCQCPNAEYSDQGFVKIALPLVPRSRQLWLANLENSILENQVLPKRESSPSTNYTDLVLSKKYLAQKSLASWNSLYIYIYVCKFIVVPIWKLLQCNININKEVCRSSNTADRMLTSSIINPGLIPRTSYCPPVLSRNDLRAQSQE